jgi:AraC-like DNA-binding protein
LPCTRSAAPPPTGSCEGAPRHAGGDPRSRALGAEILATARLASRLFDDPARRVPADEYLRLWHAIRAVSGDPDIGITSARPFVTFNPQMLGALLPHLRTTAGAVAKSPVEQARSAIAERLQGPRPTAQGVARQLTMSSRALKDSGTTYRQLLDEVRNDHARGYLRSTSFSDSEVAFLVGFEDRNSFYRAFRSWNGMSPRQFRLRASPVTTAR